MSQTGRHIMFSALSRGFAAALLLVTLALPSAAAADCYVHYKAKRNKPYGLHYGIVHVSGSCPSSPQRTVQSRISSGGWSILNIVKVTTARPNSSEIASAGSHYYR
ncbi:hypothetical protein [Antarctobacter sp.]|uniref:hypothetical protein n=1 Tax=Antarctobacter sp. TaxID=1872577 RepID=UPI002B26F36C|nr:hypothetical protein [Antarctobacter sp.]